MVEGHRAPKLGQAGPLFCGGTSVALGLSHEAGSVEELVAFEHLLLVPSPADAKADRYALRAAERARGLIGERRALRPFLEPRLDLVGEDGGLPVAPVLPGEIGVPGRPVRPEQRIARPARQRQRADRECMRPSRVGVPAPVAERIELLHVAEVEPGLPLYPFAQADLERAVGTRGERPERKRVPRARTGRAGAHHEYVGLPLAYRDDGGVKPEFDLRV